MDDPAMRLTVHVDTVPMSDVPRNPPLDDVVEYRGQPALSISRTTPAQAIVDDLLFIRRILDEHRIPFLFVRNRSDRPVLAIDSARAPMLLAALTAGCASQPFYVKMRDGKRFGPAQRLLEDGVTATRIAPVFRMFRRRVEPRSGLSYGASTAVQIELWTFGPEHVDLPSPNVLTRRRIPSGQLVRGTTHRFGETWPTIAGMFTPEATDIGFAIDLVFSWVDGSSSEWQAMRAKRMSSYVVGEEDRSPARYRHVDELKYALRSAHMYAPWVRRIFIATDSDRPPWLTDHPQVTIVRSEDFFANRDALPTHNSHAIECQLQHIPGLAEHFIYSNDDMFFGRPVKPTMFFSSGRISRFIESDVRIGLGEPDQDLSGFENAARVNRRLLLDRFGVLTTRHLAHAPTPLRRSVLEEMERVFPTHFEATAASPFRSRTDISVTNSLYHYYALLTGRAVAENHAKVAYMDSTVQSDLDAMDLLLKRRSNHFFCVNDGGRTEVEPEHRSRRVTRFLERYFPVPAPWEVA